MIKLILIFILSIILSSINSTKQLFCKHDNYQCLYYPCDMKTFEVAHSLFTTFQCPKGLIFNDHSQRCEWNDEPLNSCNNILNYISSLKSKTTTTTITTKNTNIPTNVSTTLKINHKIEPRHLYKLNITKIRDYLNSNSMNQLNTMRTLAVNKPRIIDENQDNNLQNAYIVVPIKIPTKQKAFSKKRIIIDKITLKNLKMSQGI
jgi:hypothetical protein